MKIVTAWHRGSVATGDEIREARDNRRRIISYFIILLFSYSLICAFGGGEAAAAKMCVDARSPVPLDSVTSWQHYNGIAMAGIGCRSTTTAWAIDTSGATCIGRCTFRASGPCGTLILAAEPRITPGKDGSGPANLENCQCRLVYPFVGEWIYSSYNSLTGECLDNCTISLTNANYRKLLMGI